MPNSGSVAYDFSGCVALITGGARGMGRAHAIGFARAGADVVVCDIAGPVETVPYELPGPSDLEALADEISSFGVRCVSRICDVRDELAVKELIGQSVAELGRIDVLVNNAGIESVSELSTMSEQTWDVMIDTHLKGSFLCSKHVSPHMIEAKKGVIISTGSSFSFAGALGQAHYAAAKHGLVGLTRSLAIELGRFGVRVNMVCPGSMDTQMAAGARAGNDAWAASLGEIGGKWNLLDENEALLEPEEITRAVMWLASDDAAFVTGASVVVDAGFSIK